MRLFSVFLLLTITVPTLLIGQQLSCEQSVARCIDQCPSPDALSSDSCRSFCEGISCDGYQIGSPSDSAGNREAWIVKPGRTLQSCTKFDRSECQQECRAEFDDRFKPCVDSCLISKCQLEEEQSSKAKRDQGVVDPCIELNSARCSDECPRSGSYAGLCRRDCLTKSCPNASALDIGQEANSPGQLGCQRCKERNSFNCESMCQVSGHQRPVSGLTYTACIKLCQQTSCGCW